MERWKSEDEQAFILVSNFDRGAGLALNYASPRKIFLALASLKHENGSKERLLYEMTLSSFV